MKQKLTQKLKQEFKQKLKRNLKQKLKQKLKQQKLKQKLKHHPCFNSECDKERSDIDSLSIALGSGLEEWFWKRKTSLMDLFLA